MTERIKARKNALILLVMGLFTAAFLALIFAGVYASKNLNTKELLLVHSVSRHGARTPVDTYPKDPFVNETFYPIGWGHLTNEGKLSLFRLGRQLRERYDHFLGDLYSSDVYYSQSTDSDRTIASVQLLNAGLWEPRVAQRWGPLGWQPVPVHYEPLDEDQVDWLLLVRKPCAQYDIELERLSATKPIQDFVSQHKSLFEYLEEETGNSIKNLDDLQDLYTTLQAEVAFNLTLPAWTKGYYPDLMYKPAAFSYKLRAYNAKLTRLKGGVLLKTIVDHARQKINGTSESPKFYLYGGHDSTIANLLSALKVFEEHVPEYTATVLIELYRDTITGRFFIEVFYKRSENARFEKLTLDGCESSCPFEQFLEIVEEHLPVDWKDECHTDDESYVPPPPLGP